ncbi:MAG: DUF2202 domain-containing protein [Planctomycetes bacterium]|nr:DUF2202 domain-containing protein [Planctomycetota bacterium]
MMRHLTLILSACALTGAMAFAQGNGSGTGNGGGNGGGGGTGDLLGTYLASLPLETVSAVERQELEHMRQEEKLARDVYRFLFSTWGVAAFGNIAQSEQSHMDLVKAMLDRYGIPDPLPSERVGVFRDPLFTQLYQMLTTFGAASQLHAEYVGLLIEDLDIVDLDHALAITDNRDIDTVWQNLQRGSRNHLRSFHSLVELRGFYYPGVFLTLAQVQAIVTGDRETVPVDENGVPLR